MAYDLTDLELLLQVVDRGSITQGAERAHLSLASASARITAMEKALGARSLDRCSDGLQSTLMVLASSESSPTQWTRLDWPGAELDDRTHRRTPNY
jgi:Bacterial regulatory helix-turn-helix protein, lysR family